MPALINKKTLEIIGKAQKIESEINVSDSVKINDNSANLNKILFSSGNVTITDKSVYLDTYTIRGQLRVNTLYLSEDDQIESMSAGIPFEIVGDIPEGENKTLFVSASVERINTEPLRQRRIDIDATVKIRGFAAVSGNATQSFQLENKDEIYTCTAEERASIIRVLTLSNDYEFEFDPGKIAPGKIISANVRLINPTTTSGRSAILYNALMKAEVIYSCEEDNGGLSYRVFSDTFPVNQVINTAISDEFDDYTVKADINLEDASFVFGEDGIKVKFKTNACFDALLMKEVSWQRISDIYSPAKLITAKKNMKGVSNIRRGEKQTITLSESLPLTLESDVLKIAQTGFCTDYDVLLEDEDFKVSGSISLNVFIVGESVSDAKSFNVKLPFTKMLDESGSIEDICVDLTVNGLVSEISGDRLNVSVEADLSVISLINSEIEEIEDIEANDYEESDVNYTVIKIHYFQLGETLWNIAKENRSSVMKILRDNSLECEDDVKVGQPLMITR